jgi:hypothetical protein
MIFETEFWNLKHRPDSKLPGYIILAAKKSEHHSLAPLSNQALCQLGLSQAQASQILENTFKAKLLYMVNGNINQGMGTFSYSPLL